MSLFFKYIIENITKMHIASRYRHYRKKGITVKHIAFHNVCHRLLLPGIKLLRKLRQNELIIVDDKRKDKNIPVIYACTHIGGFDIETLFEAIESPCYLFLADPREIYLNFDGLLLWLNGVLCFESDNKADRKIAKEKAIHMLKKSGIRRRSFQKKGLWLEK
ncbi:MAG: hypothetical protein ACI4TA_13380 [Acetatifactor sp.]